MDELKNLKKELKQWENEFAAANGRKPTKEEIAADKIMCILPLT